MILEGLVGLLGQRFQHEKRARVCMWFDERQEFARIVVSLADYLTSRHPSPLVLLAYDEVQRHGQIWLKRQVHRRLQAASPAERALLRFVIYLPFPEDRSEEGHLGEHARLELLEEFRAIGVTFKVGGKRPTLFSVLKQIGVAMPDGAADQRRLYEGGRDSLLSKYTAKFAGQPPMFWAATLTPLLAQSRLVGDVEQTILDVAADPEATWRSLRESGLDGEFTHLVKERYGFAASTQAPANWVEALVTTLALTETFVGCREPIDFPLFNRLPPPPVRAHHLSLVHRWLRDAEYRPAWDRWIAQVETKIDLSDWAQAATGHSVAFPHLVWQRWHKMREAFETAAAKESATEDFFASRREMLSEHAEFLKAANHDLGQWQLLCDLDHFVSACAAAHGLVAAAVTTKRLVAIYVENARAIESAHLDIRRLADESGLTAVAAVADRSYAGYTNALNEALFSKVASAGSLDELDIPQVTAHLEQSLWKATGRRAVIIVDALRYDCAVAVGDLIGGHAVEVTPVLAMLPTVTAVGMTALLPLAGASISVELKNNSLHPKVNGKDMAVRENRLAFLRNFGGDCRDIAEIEAISDTPKLGALLVVFGHEEVDHIGHGQAATLIRHVHLEVERLARLVKKLHRWGYGHVHIVTDHGFILLDEQKLPPEVLCDKAWCHVQKERYAIVPANADLPLVRLPFLWDSAVRVAVPPGLAFFKSEKSFSHGGASMQELVIPHLVSRGHVAQSKRVAVEVVLPATELQRPAVKVTLRVVLSAEKLALQLGLFAETGRTLVLDVFRRGVDGAPTSVLASKAKEVRLDAEVQEQTLTLFFHTAQTFHKGELLELDVRDVETTEQFPPGGIKLTVGRDM